jgi:ferric-dicitrate binding protein FerR (iron transport regulator)
LEGPGQLRLLAGAVYVDSPPAAAHRPFAVLTPLGPVQEIGTRFEVRLLESGEADPRTEARQLSVRVRDGRVQVTRSLVDRLPAGAGEVVHEAVAGERLDLPATGEPIRRSALSPADPLWSWTWRAGVGFAIEGATLEEFLTWYRREAGRPVTLGKSPGARAPGDIVLHGSVTGLEPDDALAVVCRSAGWQARRQAEGWFLTP